MSEILSIINSKSDLEALISELENTLHINIPSISTDIQLWQKYFTSDPNSFCWEYLLQRCLDFLFEYTNKLSQGSLSFRDLLNHLMISSLYTINYLQSNEYIKASYLLNSTKPCIRLIDRPLTSDKYTILKPRKHLFLERLYSETEKLHRSINKNQHNILGNLYNTQLLGAKNQESIYIQRFLFAFSSINIRDYDETSLHPSTFPYINFSSTTKSGEELPLKELNRRLKKSIQALDNDYNYLLNQFDSMKWNWSLQERLLYFYKLERILPLSVISDSFYHLKERLDNYHITLLLCQLPNVYTRAYVNKHFYSFSSVESATKELHYLIHTVYPLFEKLFFSILITTYNYNYNQLQHDLIKYIKENHLYHYLLSNNQGKLLETYLNFEAHNYISVYIAKIIEQLFNPTKKPSPTE